MLARWVQAIAAALCAFFCVSLEALAQPAPPWVARSEAFARRIESEGLVASDAVRAAHRAEVSRMQGRAKLQALYDIAADDYVASNSERAAGSLAALQAELRVQNDPRYRAMARLLRAYAPALDGDYVSARRNLEAALRGATDPYVRAAGERFRSYVLTDLGLVGNALEAAGAGFRGLPHEDAARSLRAGLHDAMSYVYVRVGDDEAAFDHLRQAVDLDAAAGRPIDGLAAAYNIASMLANAEQIPAALRVAEVVDEMAREHGGEQDRFFAAMLCAKVSLAAQNFARAVRCADRGRAIADAPPEYMTRLLVYRATALARLGEGRLARAALTQLRQIAISRGDPALDERITAVEPQVLRAEGRLAEAFDAMRTVHERGERRTLRRFNAGVKELRATLENEIVRAEERAAAQELHSALQKRTLEVLMLAASLAGACFIAALIIAVLIYRSRRAMVAAVCRAEQVLTGGGDHALERAALAARDVSPTARLANILDEIERRDRELRLVVEDLKFARAVAEEANSAKSQFLATMSHELRTPLNAIIGYSEMMREDAAAGERADDAADHEKVILAAKTLLTLINDLLDLSKIESGKMDLAPEEFDVAALVVDALAIVRPAAKANANRLHVDIAADVGVARSDAMRVNQCLLNLLSNAVKFTKGGDVRVRAGRARVNGIDWLEFDVADSGIGIAPAQMGRLFQPFSQADASTTRAFGGTGLGLAITRRLARLLGGDVSVASRVGQGSVFSLRIPAELREEVVARVDAAASADGAAPAHEPASPAFAVAEATAHAAPVMPAALLLDPRRLSA